MSFERALFEQFQFGTPYFENASYLFHLFDLAADIGFQFLVYYKINYSSFIHHFWQWRHDWTYAYKSPSQWALGNESWQPISGENEYLNSSTRTKNYFYFQKNKIGQNYTKTSKRVKFEESRKIPWELNSVQNRESQDIVPEGVKKENKPFRVKNQFFFYLDGNWKCQKKTKFFKWSRPKKLNSVRLLPRK